MSSTPKTPPRFLPTLTEVVEPAPGLAPASPVTNPEADGPSLDDLVAQVTQRLQETLSIEIRSVATELVLQNSRELQTYVERETLQRMQQMIEQAVRQELDKKTL